MDQQPIQPPQTNPSWRQALEQLHELFTQAVKLATQAEYESLKPVLDKIGEIYPNIAKPQQVISQDDGRLINDILKMQTALIDHIGRQKDQIGSALKKLSQGKQTLAAYSRNKL